MKDNGIWYFIANIAVFICIFVIALLVMINLVQKIILRIIMIGILFLLCGYIEERVLSKYINNIVERILEN